MELPLEQREILFNQVVEVSRTLVVHSKDMVALVNNTSEETNQSDIRTLEDVEEIAGKAGSNLSKLQEVIGKIIQANYGIQNKVHQDFLLEESKRVGSGLDDLISSARVSSK